MDSQPPPGHCGWGNWAPGRCMYVARRHSDRILPELGRLAGGMEYPTVTMAIRRLEASLDVTLIQTLFATHSPSISSCHTSLYAASMTGSTHSVA